MTESAAVITTLVGCVVSLVGVIVWAVKFAVNRFLGPEGAWDRLLNKLGVLETKLVDNTATMHRVLEKLQNASATK